MNPFRADSIRRGVRGPVISQRGFGCSREDKSMSMSVHLVGSVGLEDVDAVFETVGRTLGSYLARIPDGEPGGRRLWISWQYPLLRANPVLKVDAANLQKASA